MTQQSAMILSNDITGLGLGYPCSVTLYKCFDARLVSIHPQTKQIRVFVAYDILTEQHGNLAFLPSELDANVLQHHYDMCCIENLVAPWLPYSPRPVEHKNSSSWAVPPVPSSADTQGMGHPPEQSVAHAMLPPVLSAAPGHTVPPPSGHTAHPLSAPFSNTEVRRKRLCGAKMIEGPQEAENLVNEGCISRKVIDEEVHTEGKRVDIGREGIWLRGAEVIMDSQQARDLMKQGWILRETHRDHELPTPHRERTWKFRAQVVIDLQEAEDLMK